MASQDFSLLVQRRYHLKLQPTAKYFNRREIVDTHLMFKKKERKEVHIEEVQVNSVINLL